MTDTNNMKFEKLSRDKEENTIIMAGQVKMTVSQLEDEIKADSEIGRKLRQIEHELEKY
jgi:hypothetical protein